MNKQMKTPRKTARKSAPEHSPERQEMIARAAYLRAERRGFRGGDPVTDWLEAEAEVDALMVKRTRRAPAKAADEYLEQLKAQLKTGTERLEKLRPKLTKLKTDARKEWERELVKLDALRDNLSQHADSWRRKSEKRRAELKVQAEKILEEFKAGLDRLSSRFNK